MAAQRRGTTTVEVAGGVQMTTLPSGARVITERMPDVRSVTIGFWINCGSRDERGPVAGASHFLEHLLFKGTRRRTAQEIAESIDAVGGDMNAFTSKEYTCFYARCLDRDLPLAVDVLGDMITSSRVRTPDVDAERGVVLEEIKMHTDTPDDLVHSVFAEAWFDEHPLGREVLGSAQTITEMSRDQVNRYYRRHYVPANLVIAAAGHLQHGEVVDLVADALEDGPDGRSHIKRMTPSVNGAGHAVVRARPTEQAHVVLGGRGLARGDDRRFAASVLNQALGGGMASRLFQEVREKRGLVYSVYSYQGMHADTGTFAVYAGTTPTKTGTVLETIQAEFDSVLDQGLEERELERAKGYLAGAMVLALEDTGSRMTRLGKAAITATPMLSLDESIAAVESVSAGDVRDVAEHLLGGPFTLAVVGPFKARDEKKLRTFVTPRS